MQEDVLITAAAFGPASDVIALASSGVDVALFDVALLRHSVWTRENGAHLAESMQLAGGNVAGISFSPDVKVGSCSTSPCRDFSFRHKLESALLAARLPMCLRQGRMFTVSWAWHEVVVYGSFCCVVS
jgi:hypothetical protein